MADTPDDVDVRRYVRLTDADRSTNIHLYLIRRGSIEYALEAETGGNLSYSVQGTGSQARTKFDVLKENYIKGVRGGAEFSTVVTERLDSEGKKTLALFFHPQFGVKWPEAEDGTDPVMEDFHKILKRQVKDWRGGRSGLQVTRHRFWPTFQAMVQKEVAKEYGSNIKLYRGVFGDYAGDILRGGPLLIHKYNSWTTAKGQAKGIALHGTGGGGGGFRKDHWIVLSTKYPLKAVVFAPVTLPDFTPEPGILHVFKSEDEIVVEDKRGAIPPGRFKIESKSRKMLAHVVAARHRGLTNPEPARTPSMQEVVAERFAAQKVLFTSVVLDDASKRKLISWFEKEIGEALHPKKHAHHMTIQFKPSEDAVKKTPIGEKATLRVIGWAADDKGQAVLVRPSVPTTNKHPHITVAVNGVPPMYSNELLAKGYTKVQGPTLTGTVEAKTP